MHKKHKRLTLKYNKNKEDAYGKRKASPKGLNLNNPVPNAFGAGEKTIPPQTPKGFNKTERLSNYLRGIPGNKDGHLCCIKVFNPIRGCLF